MPECHSKELVEVIKWHPDSGLITEELLYDTIDIVSKLSVEWFHQINYYPHFSTKLISISVMHTATLFYIVFDSSKSNNFPLSQTTPNSLKKKKQFNAKIFYFQTSNNRLIYNRFCLHTIFDSRTEYIR